LSRYHARYHRFGGFAGKEPRKNDAGRFLTISPTKTSDEGQSLKESLGNWETKKKKGKKKCEKRSEQKKKTIKIKIKIKTNHKRKERHT